MAKTREQVTSTKSNGASPPAQAQPAGIMGRLGQVLRPRPQAVDAPSTAAARRKDPLSTKAPAAARQRPPMSRMLFGLMAYLIGSILLQYVLVFSSQIFKLHLERPQALFPRDTPVVGTMSTYSLLYLILLVGMVWALFRFNIIPRNMFGARTPPRSSTSSAAPSNGATRRGASRATNTTAATASKAQNRSSDVRRAPAPARTPAAGENDETYERVKSQQRSRRRKR